jgi:hypothetical protein
MLPCSALLPILEASWLGHVLCLSCRALTACWQPSALLNQWKAEPTVVEEVPLRCNQFPPTSGCYSRSHRTCRPGLHYALQGLVGAVQTTILYQHTSFPNSLDLLICKHVHLYNHGRVSGNVGARILASSPVFKAWSRVCIQYSAIRCATVASIDYQGQLAASSGGGASYFIPPFRTCMQATDGQSERNLSSGECVPRRSSVLVGISNLDSLLV